MLNFSANLGFLWTELPLTDAIHAAAAGGFDAVECHMPYDTRADDVSAALTETGMVMRSINTRIGESPDELGLAAMPGRETLARRYIDEAVEYADAIGAVAISVVAGKSGRTSDAEDTYRKNLTYAAARAETAGLTVLIEPLNTNVAADYHLVSADAGSETIDAIGASNLKLMVDCFHVAFMDGELRPVFERVISNVGHVQFASIPHRNEPDRGDVDYGQFLPWLCELGYEGPFGAEYNPTGPVEDGLGWLDTLRKESP